VGEVQQGEGPGKGQMRTAKGEEEPYMGFSEFLSFLMLSAYRASLYYEGERENQKKGGEGG